MTKSLPPVAIVAAKRTAIGNFNGALASMPAHRLGAAVIKAVLDDAKVAGAEVDDVLMGQVLTAGVGQNPARQAALAAGLPVEVPAVTINRVCGSGLQALLSGMRAIQCGHANIVVAGGQENMSQSAHVVHLREGTKMGDAALRDSMIVDGLWDCFNDYHMGITAENVAKQFNLTRQMQDEFAQASQQKVADALAKGIFAAEITPISIPQRKGDPLVFTTDEFPRLSGLDKLAALRPAFSKDGTVTAGNASGINDGAAAVVLMRLDEAEKRGLTPLATIASAAVAGVDPSVMGTGPIPASQKALAAAGWQATDLDLIEANEAFAAQALAVNQALGWDVQKVNVHGGAIALGHPIDASGARVVVTLLHAMARHKAKKGLATLCIGGGMGIAMTFAR